MDRALRPPSLLPRVTAHPVRFVAILVAALAPILGPLAIAATVGYQITSEWRAWQKTRRVAIAAGLVDAEASRRAGRLAGRPLPVLVLDDIDTKIALLGPTAGGSVIAIDAGARRVLRGRLLDAFLAHEVGHLVHRDPARELVQRALLGLLVTVAGVLPAMAFGLTGLAAGGLLLLAGGRLEGRLIFAVLRQAERVADGFAVGLVGSAALGFALRVLHHRDHCIHGLAGAVAAAHSAGMDDSDPGLLRAVDLVLSPAAATRSLRLARETLLAKMPAEQWPAEAVDLWDGGIHDPLLVRLTRLRGRDVSTSIKGRFALRCLAPMLDRDQPGTDRTRAKRRGGPPPQ